jgi:alpha-tubulin suppressor-like RCC1 family protein
LSFPTPVNVALSSVAAIAGGGLNSLALKADGTVWAWGQGFLGQLGNGADIASNVAVQVTGLNVTPSPVIAIAIGNQHCLALKADGTVWAWGDNFLGQLGYVTNGDHSNVAVQVAGLNVTPSPVIAIAADRSKPGVEGGQDGLGLGTQLAGSFGTGPFRWANVTRVRDRAAGQFTTWR